MPPAGSSHAPPPGEEPGRRADSAAEAVADGLAALRDTAGQAGTVAAGLGALLRAELAFAWRSALLLAAATLAGLLVASVLWILICALLVTGLQALGLATGQALGVVAGLNVLVLAGLAGAARHLVAALRLPRSRAALATIRAGLAGHVTSRPGVQQEG